jgi:DNA polymerase-3 subunit alpha
MKDIDSIKNILERYKGNSPLYIVLSNSRKKLMAPRELWVNINDEVITELGNAIGEENVKKA